MEEIWKDVVEYEGFYEVSNLGNVRSVSRRARTWYGERMVNGKILKFVNNVGYNTVSLCKNGVIKNQFVHRLVAMAFIDNPDNKPQIDHKNRNTKDNRVENLHWVTAHENAMNPLTRIEKSGENHFNYGNKYTEEFKRKLRDGHKSEHIPVLQYSKEGELLYEYESILEASRQTGINTTHISRCCKGLKNYKTAKGYIWRYKNKIV